MSDPCSPVRAPRWVDRAALQGWRLACSLLLTALLLPATVPAEAQTAAAPRPLPGAGEGPEWRHLSATQRKALAPLEADWPRLDAPQKQKWIEVAQRLPGMPVTERRRIQERMAAWTELTPAERGAARLRFLQASRTGPGDRVERWEAYQALPGDQKKQLAARAAQPASAPAPGNRKAIADRSARTDRVERADRADARYPGEKSNLVPNPSFGAPPRSVSPTVIQARPGATTTLVSKTPTPPPQLQTGLPKIAASPVFIDKATLLPKRGPQGAAAVAVGASAVSPDPVPRP